MSLQARLRPDQLIQRNPIPADQLPHLYAQLRANPLFQHLLQSIQLRTAELALDRSAVTTADAALIIAGRVDGAQKLLDTIDIELNKARRSLPQMDDDDDFEGAEV